MAWYNASWNYRVKITIDATKVDADLTDFPVYVDLSGLPAGFHTNVNQTDARDIRVTKTDETTEVPREIVFYNAATDTGELHFKADGVLSGTNNTDYYIYYGNVAASDYAVDDTYGSQNVWTNGYSRVYHLQQGGTIVAGSYLDSTSSAVAGTGYNDVSTNASSKINTGTTFDGTGDYIDIISNPITTTNPFTLSAWINTDVVNKYSGAIAIGPSGTNLSAYIGTVATAQVGTSNSLGGGFYGANYGTGVTTTGAWKHLAMTFAGGSNGAVNVYVDGVSLVNTTRTPNLSGTAAKIGRIGTDTTYDFDGSIDEARISSDDRAGEWISTEYNNQNSPATFYNVGEEEPQPSSGGVIINPLWIRSLRP
jgi:hypothetical protein